MLVLSRKENESMVIRLPNGSDIIVTLTEYCGNQTKVGITAPKEVLIMREELLDEQIRRDDYTNKFNKVCDRRANNLSDDS